MGPLWRTALRKIGSIHLKRVFGAVVETVLQWDAPCRVRGLCWCSLVRLRVDRVVT